MTKRTRAMIRGRWTMLLSAMLVTFTSQAASPRPGSFNLMEASIEDIQSAILGKHLTSEQLVRG
ncbi:MAG TPA: hypothetical protein VK629_20170, partial [Steroidobacteraceae bacterium]|nr:hypothetical protein [Steroidobacteraceae bacterium]